MSNALVVENNFATVVSFILFESTENHRSLLVTPQQLNDDVLGEWTFAQWHVACKK